MIRSIPEALRRSVTQRANSCCEYCLLHTEDSLYPHEFDHIIAKKHRGLTISDNLCLSCLECNRHKGSDFASFDPDTDEVAMLFHPRQDKWDDHFRLDGAYIIPLTPKGRVTVFLLQFNDRQRITERANLIEAGSYPPKLS